jgi:hypothetical protein
LVNDTCAEALKIAKIAVSAASPKIAGIGVEKRTLDLSHIGWGIEFKTDLKPLRPTNWQRENALRVGGQRPQTTMNPLRCRTTPILVNISVS